MKEKRGEGVRAARAAAVDQIEKERARAAADARRIRPQGRKGGRGILRLAAPTGPSPPGPDSRPGSKSPRAPGVDNLSRVTLGRERSWGRSSGPTPTPTSTHGCELC